MRVISIRTTTTKEKKEGARDLFDKVHERVDRQDVLLAKEVLDEPKERVGELLRVVQLQEERHGAREQADVDEELHERHRERRVVVERAAVEEEDADLLPFDSLENVEDHLIDHHVRVLERFRRVDQVPEGETRAIHPHVARDSSVNTHQHSQRARFIRRHSQIDARCAAP